MRPERIIAIAHKKRAKRDLVKAAKRKPKKGYFVFLRIVLIYLAGVLFFLTIVFADPLKDLFLSFNDNSIKHSAIDWAIFLLIISLAGIVWLFLSLNYKIVEKKLIEKSV